MDSWLAGGECPDRSAGDAGMVPLTSRETAKGGECGGSCYFGI
nr:hypothetical protein [Clostridium sp. AM16-23]